MHSKGQILVTSCVGRTALTALLAATTFLVQPAVALQLKGPAIVQPGIQTIQSVETSPFDELNRALEEVRSKLDQLTDGADLSAHVTSLREQLEGMQEENRRLHEQLDGVADLRRELTERDERIAALSSQEEALRAAARRAAEKATRLDADLKAARQGLGASEQARKAAEDRLTDMQTVARSALSEAAEAGRALVEMKEQLATQADELETVVSSRQRAERELAAARAKAEGLEQELAQVRLALDERVNETERLTKQVAALEEAATSARDVARANLEAVESKIETINRLMDGMRPAAHGPAAGAGNDGPAEGEQAGPEVRPAVATRELAPVKTANATESQDLAELKEGTPRQSAPPRTVAELVQDLPLERRVQARSLLADLKAETRDGGVLMHVPGEELFALDSEKIEPTAHDTLAKVAELISLFGNHEVQITGHTDALGDAVYNLNLSERRAELVKRFFVENYGVDDARLKVAGLGERAPIATNTTRQGRRANRRVEVMILD